MAISLGEENVSALPGLSQLLSVLVRDSRCLCISTQFNVQLSGNFPNALVIIFSHLVTTALGPWGSSWFEVLHHSRSCPVAETLDHDRIWNLKSNDLKCNLCSDAVQKIVPSRQPVEGFVWWVEYHSWGTSYQFSDPVRFHFVRRNPSTPRLHRSPFSALCEFPSLARSVSEGHTPTLLAPEWSQQRQWTQKEKAKNKRKEKQHISKSYHYILSWPDLRPERHPWRRSSNK